MMWELIASLFPNGVELDPKNDFEAVVKGYGKEINIICNEDNSYVINGVTLHFEDVNIETINTLLVPYILEQLDGEKRI